MADEKQAEQPDREPRTPREARRMRKEWTGIVSTHKRPNLNRPGVNLYEGTADLPKSSGLRLRRWEK